MLSCLFPGKIGRIQYIFCIFSGQKKKHKNNTQIAGKYTENVLKTQHVLHGKLYQFQ
jgi:hypothetical protein